MKAAVCLLVVLIAPLFARAAQEIEGTVGVKLGEKFPISITIKSNSYVAAPTLLRFEPTNAVAPFVEYRATLHPVDGRVMMIDAQRGVINARKEWSRLKDLIAKAHGAPQEIDEKNYRASWRNGSRGIELVGFKEYEDAFLRIVYFDKALLEKSKKDAVPPSDKIEGTAGVNLGETFPSQITVVTNGAAPEPGLVLFSPTNAVAPFRDYRAKLHPVSRKVMQITSYVDLSGGRKAEEEWEKLQFQLTSKHGEPVELDRARFFVRWSKDGRAISLFGPSVNTPDRLAIAYVDEALAKSAAEAKGE